jgi:hypothetical protein
MRAAIFAVLLVAALLPQCFSVSDPETRSISSDFLYSADGWSKAGKDAASVEMMHAPMLVQGRDDGKRSWWFSAPQKFLGDQTRMYRGSLSLRVGFWEYSGEFINSSSANQGSFESFDVILTSQSAGISLGRNRLLLPLAFIQQVSAELWEGGGWVVIHPETSKGPSITKHPNCSHSDFLKVVTSLSSLWVRGGYYTGAEETYIMSVSLSPPHETHTEGKMRTGGRGDGKATRRTNPNHDSQIVGETARPAATPPQTRQGSRGKTDGEEERVEERTVIEGVEVGMSGGQCKALQKLDGALLLKGGDGCLALTANQIMYEASGGGRGGGRGEAATAGGVSSALLQDITSVDIDQHDQVIVFGEKKSRLLSAGRLESYHVTELGRFFEQVKARSDSLSTRQAPAASAPGSRQAPRQSHSPPPLESSQAPQPSPSPPPPHSPSPHRSPRTPPPPSLSTHPSSSPTREMTKVRQGEDGGGGAKAGGGKANEKKLSAKNRKKLKEMESDLDINARTVLRRLEVRHKAAYTFHVTARCSLLPHLSYPTYATFLPTITIKCYKITVCLTGRRWSDAANVRGSLSLVC